MQPKRPRPCMCSSKIRKKDDITNSYLNPSTVEKPLLIESTRIDENEKIYRPGNTNNFIMPEQGKLTLSSIIQPKTNVSKGGETLKVTFKESPGDFKRYSSSANKLVEPSDETYDLETTKEADSMHFQNNRFIDAKLIKEETNTSTKMGAKRMCADSGFQAYQQHACTFKQCNMKESSSYRTNEPNYHSPSDKHNLRKEDCDLNKSRARVDADTDTVSSVLLRYLPSFSLSCRKKKDVSSPTDQANKHPNKRFQQEDATVMEKLNYAKNIKRAPAGSSAPCCSSNSKDSNAKGIVPGGRKCSVVCPMEENHLKTLNSANTRHQNTMTELRDEMLAKIDLAQSYLMKTLIEIKEHTKNLAEQFSILNKHMDTESYSQVSMQNRSIAFRTASLNEEDNEKNNRITKKNEKTQEPDKKNACVQKNEYSVCVS